MRKAKCRGAITLLELLVVIAIVGVIMGLLLGVVQQVRHAAAFAEGQNKLHQIGIAVHSYAENHNGSLPRNMTIWALSAESRKTGAKSVKAKMDWFRTANAELLPYLEQTRGYEHLFLRGNHPVTSPDYVRVARIFRNPLDPSPDVVDSTCSYVNNAHVFSVPHTMQMIRDGMSNTIFFTEHYRSCGSSFFDLFTITVFERYRMRLSGLQASAPTFADHGYNRFNSGPDPAADFYPITKGDPPRSTALYDVTFQLAPSENRCDPRLPNAASTRGLQVLMGDGSVRTVHRLVSPYVFWGAVTPSRGEVDLPDF